MGMPIKQQGRWHLLFFACFGIVSASLMLYYLTNTLIHYTTDQQFPIDSFKRLPLTALIFPAEMFSFLFAMYFVYTLFADRHRAPTPMPLAGRERIRIALLIPVYHEPTDVVERTINACKRVRWPGGTRIYLLDDSKETEFTTAMAALARKHGCAIVRRPDRKGYKAGNVNNAIRTAVKEEFFAILDADQAPEQDFLERTVDHFSDPSVAFVQTPQYYVGEKTVLERTAKMGANIFFQAMCVGRARDKAMVFCGTNAVIRTEAFRAVKGLSYYMATEDIELGLRMNEEGYHGVYVPEVLVRGYAPPDFKAYSSQQYRWANGNLAILREAWKKILFGKFTLRQQIHTLFALGWWLIGIVTLIYIITPILSLFLGLGTHHTWLPTAILIALYCNVVLGVGMIYAALQGRVEGDRMTVRDAILQYLLITNSVFIYARAAVNAALRRYVGFVRTNKTKSVTGLGLIKWNLITGTGLFAASIYALYHAAIASDAQQLRTYLPISVWLLLYAFIMLSAIIFVVDADEPSGTKHTKEAHA